MKVLLFSDLHAHAFQANSTVLPSGRNSRLQDAVSVLDEIDKLAKEHDVDGILFGGDLFHIRPGLGSMKIPTFNAIYEAVAKLKIGRQFVGLLVGNHDQGDKQGKEHSVYAFKSIVTVMDDRDWYTFTSYNEQICVFAVPAATDIDDLKAAIKVANTQIAPTADVVGQIMLGHLGVDGAEVGTNFKLRDKNILKVSDLCPREFDYVFLGDYHKPQLLADNAMYIGATHHHNWGDANQDRRVLILDTGDNTVQSIELESPPRFWKCPLDEVDKINPENKFIRIVCPQLVPSAQQETISEELKAAGALSVDFWLEPTAKPASETDSEFSPTMDQESMVDTYVNQEDPDDLDHKLLAEIGRDIFNKAMARVEE